jgi:hypothetical protein
MFKRKRDVVAISLIVLEPERQSGINERGEGKLARALYAHKDVTRYFAMIEELTSCIDIVSISMLLSLCRQEVRPDNNCEEQHRTVE